VTASIRDTSVNGLEGLNIKISAPFKFHDYIFGFKYSLSDLRNAPEQIFGKRTFNTNVGSITVDADYTISNNNVGVSTSWSNKPLGVGVSLSGDTQNRLKSVGASKSLHFKDSTLNLNAAYDVLRKKFSGHSRFAVDSTAVDLSYDTEAEDPVLSIAKSLDANNEVSPSMSLKTGDISYGYTRKWSGGAISTRLFPGERVKLSWRDNGASGSWITTADVPLADKSNTKITFSRDWQY
jgi:hypothetical protein